MRLLCCHELPALDLGAFAVLHRESEFHLPQLLFFKVATKGETLGKGVEIGTYLGCRDNTHLVLRVPADRLTLLVTNEEEVGLEGQPSETSGSKAESQPEDLV